MMNLQQHYDKNETHPSSLHITFLMKFNFTDVELSFEETEVLKQLAQSGEIQEDFVSPDRMTREKVRSSISWLEKKNLIAVRLVDNIQFVPGKEASGYDRNGLPELVIYRKLSEVGNMSINEVYRILGDESGRIAIAQLSRLGIKPLNGILIKTDSGIEKVLIDRQSALRKIVHGQENFSEGEKEQVELLLKRSGMIEKKLRKIRFVSINDLGRETVGKLGESSGIGQLTKDIILNGSYKEKGFRSYDLNMPGIMVHKNTAHPLRILINEVRQIFISLGFEEIRDNYIESAGWNMDALFIPQNHPARDMQDTFFLENSGLRLDIEDINLFRRIGRIHEHGFKGYSGWGYRWSMEEAEKLLLRTHTTASTMRHLHKFPDKEQALFSVDRIFRHESMDWKHLSEFHQVEGVIHSPNATLQTLKWILRKFYRELGFDNVELIPSYYPYTEPSMGVVVEINGKEVEMGGSGIIRPEVNRMMGLKHNVIAWGLGLERLAMLYYDIDDVRKIYNSDLNWLQNYRIKL